MSNVSHLNVKMSGNLEESFPQVDPLHTAFGSRILVQYRVSKKKTAGGILLPSDTKDTEIWNTQTAKIISVGPLAFRNRQSMEPWPEGAWAQVGDYVRVPKHAGDRWQVAIPGKDQEFALFAFFNDTDLLGKCHDPLAVVAFV